MYVLVPRRVMLYEYKHCLMASATGLQCSPPTRTLHTHRRPDSEAVHTAIVSYRVTLNYPLCIIIIYYYT